MKIVNLMILVLFSLITSANTDDLNRLIDRRNQQNMIYQSLVDSAITNRWVKQSLIFNQLQVIKSLDDSIIDRSALIAKTYSSIDDSLNKSNSQLLLLSNEVDRVKAKAVNDMRMLLILKIAVAVLLLVVLALIYVLYRKRPGSDQKKDMLEKKVRELEVERDHTKNEILRLKNSESQLKNELEKGVQVNSYIKQITQERDKLAGQIESLNNQLADSKTKHEAMLRKINKLISDLSGVND